MNGHDVTVQAAQEMINLLKAHYGLGPGYQARTIDGCPGAELITISVRSENYNPVTLAHTIVDEFARGASGYDTAGRPKV